MRVLAALCILAVLVMGCAGSAPPTPSTTVVASIAPSVTPAAAKPTSSPTPTLAVVRSPSPVGDVTMASTLYPYTLTVPGDAVAVPPTRATVAWDGTNKINSADTQTDWLLFEGGRTFFVYGAPTDATLTDFAASSQAQVAEWHGCPDQPESTADVTVGGAPGRLHVFHCGGYLVMKLMTVSDGFGLVLNQLTTDADPATEQSLLLDRIAGLTWTN